MLTALIDFFCARQSVKPLSWRGRLGLSAQAVLWAAVAFVLGLVLVGDFAAPGENMQALAAFSGASPVSQVAFPGLWSLKYVLLGASPSMVTLNLFGAGVVAWLVAMTWLVVEFWVRDAMAEADLSTRAVQWTSAFAAHGVCAFFLFSLTGLYVVSGWTVTCWSFAWLLTCVVLQNIYAGNNGRRCLMVLAAFVLGMAAVESTWVLLCLPLFFLRAVIAEWRLWDRNVKNLPLWFIMVVLGVGVMLVFNGLRSQDVFTLKTIISVELEVLRVHLQVLRGCIAGPFLIHLAGVVIWPLLAWLTAVRLLNNDRAWGLLVTALVLSFAGFALAFGVEHTPLYNWFSMGQVPVVSTWVTAFGCGVLLVGWGMQFFARKLNLAETGEQGHSNFCATAMWWTAIVLFPISLIAAGVTLGMQGYRFSAVDRAMLNRFAGETISQLRPGGAAEGRQFLLGATWLDGHLALEAHRQGVPLTLFVPARATDAPYLRAMRTRLMEDPLLVGADRLRLVHLLDYNFFVFVQDFFVSQENVTQIAAVMDLPDVWYAAHRRPFVCGPFFLGLSETDVPPYDPLPVQRALESRWAATLEAEELPWWDINRASQRAIRHHLAFVSNNLGAFLDDQGKLEEAAECYFYAYQTEPENVSALLNLYDICVRRGALPGQREAVNRAFQTFISTRTKSPKKYDLSSVGRYYGYIRNYELFVQMGWEWAVSAAPESVLAGLRNAQNGLAPTDPRNAAVQAVVAAVYESQGQIRRSMDNYRAAVSVDPKNVEALRGLARLSIQDGKVIEAGQWLSKAEEAGADQTALDIDRAAYLMAMGDLDGATAAIGRYTTTNKDTPIGWAMLGMIEIERGNIERASGFILQNIKRTAKGRDLYFLHVLEGRLAQAQALAAEKVSLDEEHVPSAVMRQEAAKNAGKSYETARRHYRRAYALRPNVRGLLELILEFDRKLNDKAGAEADALALLREDMRHPYANFVVGSQRLDDAEIAAAVKYFRVAVEGDSNPSFLLLNNYAEALCRARQFEQAKAVALRGVQKEPKLWAAWATYALTLARGGEGAKAQTALDTARELAASSKMAIDPRVDFVEIWIALDRGDKAKAKCMIERLKTTLGAALSPLDKMDFEVVDRALTEMSQTS